MLVAARTDPAFDAPARQSSICETARTHRVCKIDYHLSSSAKSLIVLGRSNPPVFPCLSGSSR
jgi:hypothetical protein